MNLLDHGYVNLVDHMGNDESIVRNARQSFNQDGRTGIDVAGDSKLVNYLWKHRHTTPFESVCFTFEIKAPIFVFRQWHRHRTWSYNEVSARYTELPEEFYVPRPGVVGLQSKDNKQARTIEEVDAANYHKRANEIDTYEGLCRLSFSRYKDLLAAGWPRELARMVLPLSTYSRMTGTVNLANLFKFIELRSDGHAQYEIRVYSDAMLELIKPIVPEAVKAFTNG